MNKIFLIVLSIFSVLVIVFIAPIYSEALNFSKISNDKKFSIENYKILKCGICMGDKDGCKIKVNNAISTIALADNEIKSNLEWHSKKIIFTTFSLILNNEEESLNLLLNKFKYKNTDLDEICFSKFNRECSNLNDSEFIELSIFILLPNLEKDNLLWKELNKTLFEKCLYF